ncbi:MAG: transposase, partial [Bacteroidales bacterium]|nr:transposase [Bacteroidales bacterium]
QNVGPRLSIDETTLSNGDLYTVVSNKDVHGQKGALVAIVSGTKAEDVNRALWTIPAGIRDTVEEITLDLSPSMRRIARLSFPKATRVIDRFHVQKLALKALQDVRIEHRHEALREENRLASAARAAARKGEDTARYEPKTFANGDTRRQLLARSRYLLFKSREKWTSSQKERARILFEQYPDIELAYKLTDELRKVYSSSKIKGVAMTKLAHWYDHVEKANFDSFKIIKDTVYNSYDEILNYFISRSTNASAEAFNAKIKNFRAQLRGVSDVSYFLFRLAKIYA